MKVLDLRVINGPNNWSIRWQKLIVLLLDLQDLEQLPTNKIPGFHERLSQLIPSLYDHCCSEGVEGGFFIRVKEGTWMGHVIEHIALEIQTLAGIKKGFGRTRGAGKEGVYHVVFSCDEPKQGLYAAKAAVRIAEALIKGEEYDLDKDINQIKTIWENERLGPSTASIVKEAQKRDIPFMRLDDESYVQLGYGAKQRRIQATTTDCTSAIATDLAGDKHKTKAILSKACIPVADGETIEDVSQLKQVINDIGFPVVVKPLDGNQGKGATTNINDLEFAIEAFHHAQKISKKILVEKFVEGEDFRVLVVNNRFIAAAMRTPARVVGDGEHTIQQLIDEVNKDTRRGNGHCNLLTTIVLDDLTKGIISKKGYDTSSILKKDEQLILKPTANLSTGGTSKDVTEEVHPKNRSLFERIARTIGLDICGIDLIAPDLSTPVVTNGGIVLEVNAAPGLRMHLQPAVGKRRNVAAPIVDMLFPQQETARIPIIAVTGTNGKTTTTRILSRIAKKAGYYTGYTTTDGIYMNDELVYSGDCAGPSSARMLLQDKKVEFVVLECARGGILRSGLAFDICDTAVVTNVAEDHLGLNGIDTIDKMAKVKAVVPETVKKDGYAVLNADDDLVYQMKDRVECKVALFSIHANNVRIQHHCQQGGIAAVCDEGYIMIREGNRLIPVDEVNNIPLTFSGKAKFNIANVLGAVLAAYLNKIELPVIRHTLREFQPSAETTPGRMNLINFQNFTTLVDYAHNPHGLRAVGEFITSYATGKKVGVITGVGDRRDADIIAMGEEAAKIFDEVVIRLDEDLRGRKAEEINTLVRKGIHKVDPDKEIFYFTNEKEAVDFVITSATPDSFVAIFVENVDSVYEWVKHHHDRENITSKEVRLVG